MTAEVRDYVLEHLGKEGIILAVDETGFIKQGEHSVGVQVQHCSLTGRLENCRSWSVPRLHQPAWTHIN